MSETLTLTWSDQTASKTDNAAGYFSLAKRFDSLSIQLRADAIGDDYAARQQYYYVGIFPGETEPAPADVSGMVTCGWSNNTRAASTGTLRTFTEDSEGNPFTAQKYWVIIKYSGSAGSTNSGTVTAVQFYGEPHGAPSVFVKTGESTWSEAEAVLVKTDASTWSEVTAMYAKTDASTWDEADG